ncbi:Protein FAR1-RELATED SEQUENCE 5 [Hordeum vulgare]|nr:Protein FAR1-RELATED SEQUENCE 5 [Hordeum vulgare]
MSDSEIEDTHKCRNCFVKAAVEEGEYYFECCKFELDGIVCCHILKVKEKHVLKHLPRHFIRRRWTWDADDALGMQTLNALLAIHEDRPEATMDSMRHVVLTKDFAGLIDDACKSYEMGRIADKHRKAFKRDLDNFKKRKAKEALDRFPSSSNATSSTGQSSENSKLG